MLYYTATSLARFDGTSHILPLFVIAPQNGACGQYATKPVAGCSAHYGQEPAYQPRRAARARRRRRRVGGQRQQPHRRAAGAGRQRHRPSPSQPAPAAGATGALPAPLPAPPTPTSVLQALSSFLLK